MGHSFDMLTFDFLLKPPQPITGLFFSVFIMNSLLWWFPYMVALAGNHHVTLNVPA